MRIGGNEPDPEPDPDPIDIVREQYKLGQAHTGETNTVSFDDAPTVGNLLVAISGHRTARDDPGSALEDDGWELRVVKTNVLDNLNERRAIALWSKIAEPGDQNVEFKPWGGTGDTGDSFVILQEFSGASSYNFEVGGGNSISGDDPGKELDIPASPLTSPGEANIIAIAGMVWRGWSSDPSSIENPVFTDEDLGGVLHNTEISTIPGASGFTWTTDGDKEWQTTAEWENERLRSGLLALFSFE